jgi:hypothetical protein
MVQSGMSWQVLVRRDKARVFVMAWQGTMQFGTTGRSRASLGASWLGWIRQGKVSDS